jgi:O-antigen biosynthesis protein WbqV
MKMRFPPLWLTLAHDAVMAAAAFVGAVVLRVGWEAFEDRPELMGGGTALFVAIALLSNRLTGLHRGVWRYTALTDLLTIAKAATLTVAGFAMVMFLVQRGDFLPRTSLFYAWGLLILLLIAGRAVYRGIKERSASALLSAAREPVVVIGAGDEADLFLASLRRSNAPYRVVALIDERERRKGQAIRGVRVEGGIDDLPALLERLAARDQAPQKLILAQADAKPEAVRRLLELAQSLSLPLVRVPRLTDFRAGDAPVQLQPVALEDLLGRPPLPLDRAPLENLVRGRRVLVTGAGGSIGSELVRQIAALGPEHLTLLDASEYALYAIDLQVSETYPALPRVSVLADVRDAARISRVFTEARPDLVFHAAAIKHVPLAEANPLECFATNILGSRIVAEASRAVGARAMVQISTDKAVNPTNVMGASKRVAEMWAQAQDLAENSGMRCVLVRFGNVLGSTGSVIPLFQRQLQRGGPLTVTHAEITRYFMTIAEAVELVLHASAYGTTDAAAPGRIFVLDMGEPVKIIELARQMIRLHGLRPEVDIPIDITGLRPGEKLYEELFHDAETLDPTPVAGVRLAAPRTVALTDLTRDLDALADAIARGDTRAAFAILHRLVPEFSPSSAS